MSAVRLVGLGVLMLLVVWAVSLHALLTGSSTLPVEPVVAAEAGAAVDLLAAALRLLLVKLGVAA